MAGKSSVAALFITDTSLASVTGVLKPLNINTRCSGPYE